MTKQKKDHPVVATAKGKQARCADDGVRLLSTGIRGTLKPVPAGLIDEVQARIADPPVPVWHNPDKDRDEPNPNDPAYLAACEENDRKRVAVILDTFAMFGLEMADPIPEDGKWVWQLKRLGIEFDADDPLEREFHYKRYVALGVDDLVEIGAMSGIPRAALAVAADTFQREEARGAAGKRPAKR